MSSTPGPFHLVLCPGAWCPASQWMDFSAALHRSPVDVRGISTAHWPTSGQSGLAEHVEAVLAAVPEGSGPLVLLGHSFGTFPMLEAASALGDRVHGVVFVDGFLPSHGLSAFAHSQGHRGPDAMRAAARSGARSGAVPPPDPAIWGLKGVEAEQVARTMQPHSLRSFEESISASAAAVLETLPKRAYIGASQNKGPGNPFKRAFESLEGREDWFSVQINGGHMLHVERPAALAYWCAQFLAMVAGKRF